MLPAAAQEYPRITTELIAALDGVAAAISPREDPYVIELLHHLSSSVCMVAARLLVRFAQPELRLNALPVLQRRARSASLGFADRRLIRLAIDRLRATGGTLPSSLRAAQTGDLPRPRTMRFGLERAKVFREDGDEWTETLAPVRRESVEPTPGASG